MTITAHIYRPAGVHLLRGRFGDLLTADLRLMLATDDYTPADTDDYLTVPAAFETAGAGYPPGGVTVAGRDVVTDTLTGRTALTLVDLAFVDAGWSARWAVAYVATGDPATSPLLAYIDLTGAGNLDGDGDDITLEFPAGLLRTGPW